MELIYTRMFSTIFILYNLEFTIFLNKSPMIAGLYAGKKKPADFSDFFKDFNEELLGIIRKEICYKNKINKVKVRCFIADTPARADCLNIVGHTVFNSCNKCKIPCERRKTDSSVIFKGENYPVRSNYDFRQLKDPEHHRGKSALDSLPLGSVSQTPHDYMHLVCLGLMKKILEALIEGKFQPKKLSPDVTSRISSRLITFAEYCPREFSRKPRSLDYLHRFKATEYRQFLLYTGPTIMLDLFGEDKRMKHFLKLHYAIRILVSLNERLMNEIDMAEDILRQFVFESADIYGRRFLSYNTHSLLHLANDARNFGPLDHFSCFPFENNMTFFRKMVRKPSQELQQIYKRFEERKQLQLSVQISSTKIAHACNVKRNSSSVQSSDHNINKQCSKIKYRGFTYDLSKRNNCCISCDGNVYILRNILYVNNTNSYHLKVQKFQEVDSLYNVDDLDSELEFLNVQNYPKIP